MLGGRGGRRGGTGRWWAATAPLLARELIREDLGKGEGRRCRGRVVGSELLRASVSPPMAAQRVQELTRRAGRGGGAVDVGWHRGRVPSPQPHLMGCCRAEHGTRVAHTGERSCACVCAQRGTRVRVCVFRVHLCQQGFAHGRMETQVSACIAHAGRRHPQSHSIPCTKGP